MSVMPMLKLGLVFLKQDREKIIDVLQEISAIHIEDPILANEHIDLDPQIAKLGQKISSVKNVLQKLEQCETSFKNLPPAKLNIHDLTKVLFDLSNNISKDEAQLKKLNDEIVILSNYGCYSEDPHMLNEIGFSLIFADIKENETDKLAGHIYKLLKRSKDCGHYAILLKKGDNFPFEHIKAPKINLNKLKKQRTVTEERLKKNIQTLTSFYPYKLTLQNYESELFNKQSALIELKKSKKHDNLIQMSGYIRKKDLINIKNSLADHDIAFTVQKISPQDTDVPVSLQNKSFYRSFEWILKSFSGISYQEKDLTFFIMLLFLLFGSLCLLDGGYGLLLVITGLLVKIKVDKTLGQIFLLTGLSATIVGFMAGQFFGFMQGTDFFIGIQPIISIAKDPMSCFKFSLFIGASSMILSNTLAIWQNGFKTNASGSLLLGISVLLYMFSLPQLGKIFIFAAVSSWLFFPEKVFSNEPTVANVLWTYYSGGVGIIQDILSHMRLFGIALSGSILALVINKIAFMLPVGFNFLFLAFGHIMVFFLSLLSLYIHTNRLIFLEFGQKCIKGGHRYFTPFKRRVIL